MICSAEPIMAKWKWAIALHVPAKVLIVNENVDYFWFDWSNRKIIGEFALFRAGLTGADAVRSIARLVFFPFTLLYCCSMQVRSISRERWLDESKSLTRLIAAAAFSAAAVPGSRREGHWRHNGTDRSG